MLNWFAKKSSEPKTLGRVGEELAQAEYRKLGFKIIAKNEYNKKGKRLGEIDFIAADKSRIVFVEVKTRNPLAGKFGTGAEAVNIFKQRKILAAVKMYFLRNRQYQHLRPQIDVCVMEYSGVDISFKPAKIIANAVEDWS